MSDRGVNIGNVGNVGNVTLKCNNIESVFVCNTFKGNWFKYGECLDNYQHICRKKSANNERKN